MLRKVLIFKNKTTIFEKEYGKSLPEETVLPIIESLRDYLKHFDVDVLEFMQVINFKLCYATNVEFGLLFILICDPTDPDDSVREETKFLRHKFLEKFRDTLTTGSADPDAYKNIQADVTISKSELRPKISLVGFSGVGKTTITKLIKEEELPTRHIPTITGYISEIAVGDFEMYLWDLAGQVRYAEVWAQFMRGSDVIILIVDSTEQNVYESRFFTELCRKEAPYARLAIIANKQDLPGAMSPEQIGDVLDAGTYGYRVTPLVAIDVKQRIDALRVMAETAATNAKTLAEFQTLEDRKWALEDAKSAIDKGNLKEAAKILDEIEYLSRQKGDPEGAEQYASYSAYIRSQNKTIEMKMKLVYNEIKEKSDEYL
ncbi:MAG: GTP-binding protein [Candidatus Helarchaeota archaeon]|nr:GTP-binding protein [Candidatus Helarchaeota archaeon]